MAWSATTAGVSAEMVSDLMIACVERRFGATKTPHPVEWLSDNGSAYIARQTGETTMALGLRLLFTPVRSPQSNGHLRGVREDAQARLCSPRHPSRRRNRQAASARLVRGLQQHSPALRPTHALAPRVPHPECLNPPRRLSGQTGCTPEGRWTVSLTAKVPAERARFGAGWAEGSARATTSPFSFVTRSS
uniref:Integrase catalytic protein n=1 Tax=Pseudomonas sp. K-62 TaxID=76885 RepID=I2FG45_9PSED|nr:integrase catalytic protein [Pseudomonas sp. K-62]